ncbi:MULTISPECIES: hypothetical protein [unclassified Solwaraspora]|uniref:hypothetical protein n=1 Tax=unclassified Solwaraspora TaxID=2627926 RepID=UPI00259BBFF8|nr:hypothetical protein [Solwaraspora sp. WMMA2056]WJK43022.1 hypothetical protein O7608_11885 [Solwaraspora sp. WMMA2056]
MSIDGELSPSATTDGWVLTTNVRALIESLAELVHYEADDWDWDAIASGLDATDADDPHRWYDYPLIGTSALRLELANDLGSTITSARIRHPSGEALTARIETIVSMLARYQVTS